MPSPGPALATGSAEHEISLTDNPAMTETTTSSLPTAAAQAATDSTPLATPGHTPPPADPAPPAQAAAASPAAPGGGLWGSVALWRSLAIFFIIVMLLAGSTWMSMVEMANTHINNLTKRLAEAPVIDHVAVLNDAQGEAAVLVTFAPQKQQLRLQRVGSYQEADDRALHLWAMPASGEPRFLGVLGRGKLERLEVTEQDVKDAPRLAVSLETRNAPNAGQPKGPVLFKGTLILNRL